MASCSGCGKPNDYIDSAYTCWECTNFGTPNSKSAKVITKGIAPKCRPRYTYQEWEDNWRRFTKNCMHCGRPAGSHCGGSTIPWTHKGISIQLGGACYVSDLKAKGIDTSATNTIGAANPISSEYVYEFKA